jgi:hypothetical protein
MRSRLTFQIWLGLLFLTVLQTLLPFSLPSAQAVDRSSLRGKLIFGYQGWFQCPGDDASQGWRHWFGGTAPTTDLLPDVTELRADEQCATGWMTADGHAVHVFSSQNARTVARHFAWMRQYGLDGVALQRFATALKTPETRSPLDRVLANVRTSAEAEERSFFLMYDLSGMTSDALAAVAEDWASLERDGLTGSPAYQRHLGRPVLALWGLGFNGRPISPAAAKRLTQTLRDQSAPYRGVTLLVGVPAGWRIHSGDASTDSAWDEVYRSADIISPWTVGRYRDDVGADVYRRNTLEPDLVETRRTGLGYMPVIFPGFSWANLMRARSPTHKALPNEIPRRCGDFYWRQVFNAISGGASMIYNAMFDEVDEGTAMFKMVPNQNALPIGADYIALDADGCALPSDWYLQLAGKATLALKTGGPISPDLPLIPKRR